MYSVLVTSCGCSCAEANFSQFELKVIQGLQYSSCATRSIIYINIIFSEGAFILLHLLSIIKLGELSKFIQGAAHATEVQKF